MADNFEHALPCMLHLQCFLLSLYLLGLGGGFGHIQVSFCIFVLAGELALLVPSVIFALWLGGWPVAWFPFYSCPHLPFFDGWCV